MQTNNGDTSETTASPLDLYSQELLVAQKNGKQRPVVGEFSKRGNIGMAQKRMGEFPTTTSLLKPDRMQGNRQEDKFSKPVLGHEIYRHTWICEV